MGAKQWRPTKAAVAVGSRMAASAAFPLARPLHASRTVAGGAGGRATRRWSCPCQGRSTWTSYRSSIMSVFSIGYRICWKDYVGRWRHEVARLGFVEHSLCVSAAGQGANLPLRNACRCGGCLTCWSPETAVPSRDSPPRISKISSITESVNRLSEFNETRPSRLSYYSTTVPASTSRSYRSSSRRSSFLSGMRPTDQAALLTFFDHVQLRR